MLGNTLLLLNMYEAERSQIQQLYIEIIIMQACAISHNYIIYDPRDARKEHFDRNCIIFGIFCWFVNDDDSW